MAITTIKLSEAQSATNAIRSKVKAQLEIIDGYKKFISQLQANWGGEGCKAFMAAFDKLSPNMKKMLEEMNGYNDQIIKLLAKMQETDDTAAKWFEAV